MAEIELKLEVPPARRAAVDAAVAGRVARAPLRLQAAYHDTADGRLAAARLALRLRREGRRWVQTLKGAGDDGLTRAEHEVARGSAAAMPAIDPRLHADTPVGTRLLALLDGPPPAALAVVYRTDVRRRVRVQRLRGGAAPAARVELAFDRGRIEAGGRTLEISELELELVAGTPLALIEAARGWQVRFGLWLDVRSKAERGERLARGSGEAAAAAGRAAPFDRHAGAADAWRAALRAVAAPLLAAASRVAGGATDAETVHQLRVALRRLRSVVALFADLAGVPEATALDDGAAALFRSLGAARDAAVIDSAFGASLRTAMQSARLSFDALRRSDATEVPSPVAAVRATPAQGLLFDLLGAIHASAAAPGTGPPPAALRAHLAKRLGRWHRQVAADARRYAELDDAARHRLRKRAKRLRYAVECCAGAFGAPRRERRYLKALRALQERLGAVTDATMALGAFAPRAPVDAAAAFAVGWLAAHRDALVAAAADDLATFANVEPCWRER